MVNKSALLVLEDGTVFRGVSRGSEGLVVGEVVFNTSMTGYQEILTDPSYAGQLVTMTYPHIGNTGINFLDNESTKAFVSGFIMRDMPLLFSSWRSQQTLTDYLIEQKKLSISDIDTRHLVHILRKKGSLAGCIMAGDNVCESEALKKARAFRGLEGTDLAKEVTTPQDYEWTYQAWCSRSNSYPNVSKIDKHIVVMDFGVKQNILRIFCSLGCRVTVVSAYTTCEEIFNKKPDGVFLSNGPGDPAACDYAIQTTQQLLKLKMPIFGICLGHQLLALASGAKTVKMKFGHHGANHPVQNLDTNQVMITSQNHSFTVDENSLPECLQATHRSLFDGTLQGIKHIDAPAFSFQGHPEASPGPHDLRVLFDQFIQMMNS